jgi:hypothetical protein
MPLAEWICIRPNTPTPSPFFFPYLSSTAATRPSFPTVAHMSHYGGSSRGARARNRVQGCQSSRNHSIGLDPVGELSGFMMTRDGGVVVFLVPRLTKFLAGRDLYWQDGEPSGGRSHTSPQNPYPLRRPLGHKKSHVVTRRHVTVHILFTRWLLPPCQIFTLVDFRASRLTIRLIWKQNWESIIYFTDMCYHNTYFKYMKLILHFHKFLQ